MTTVYQIDLNSLLWEALVCYACIANDNVQVGKFGLGLYKRLLNIFFARHIRFDVNHLSVRILFLQVGNCIVVVANIEYCYFLYTYNWVRIWWEFTCNKQTIENTYRSSILKTFLNDHKTNAHWSARYDDMLAREEFCHIVLWGWQIYLDVINNWLN